MESLSYLFRLGHGEPPEMRPVGRIVNNFVVCVYDKDASNGATSYHKHGSSSLLQLAVRASPSSSSTFPLPP